jgi:hypothetical protein
MATDLKNVRQEDLDHGVRLWRFVYATYQEASMAIVALILSLSVAALGAVGIVSPMKLLSFVRQFQHPAGLYVAAILRVVFGVALFLAAPTSRSPEVVRIVGIIVFVSGFITPLFGLERFRRILNWWSARGPAFQCVWAGFVLSFGLLLAYAVVP